MRIFLLIRSLDVGGAERQIVTLANALAGRGHEVELGVFYSGGALTREVDGRVTLIDFRKSGRWDVIPFMHRVAKHIRESHPDVIYTFLGTANAVCALLKPFLRKTPLVWSILASNMNLDQFGFLHQLHFKVECLLSRVPDRIIANSHAGKEHVAAHGFPRERIAVIPNGVEMDRFKPGLPPDTEIKRPGQRSVGMVARLDPMKDHETFIRAAALVAKEMEDVRFYCIGHAPKERRIPFEQLARELNISEKLNWVEARPDMPTVYNSLDVNCLASFGEGTPNVLIEAMACGTPCVASDVGDAAIILGDCGEIVPVGDHEAMGKAIARRLKGSLDEQNIPRLCRERVKGEFSLETHLNKTEDAFQEIIAHSS